jgi:hypothetical protein
MTVFDQSVDHARDLLLALVEDSLVEIVAGDFAPIRVDALSRGFRRVVVLPGQQIFDIVPEPIDRTLADCSVVHYHLRTSDHGSGIEKSLVTTINQTLQ